MLRLVLFFFFLNWSLQTFKMYLLPAAALSVSSALSMMRAVACGDEGALTEVHAGSSSKQPCSS